MRIAIVSDIHGNRAALESVLRDLRETSPDLVMHAGDLADSGSDPAWVVDTVRDLDWPGVMGNTDEMLVRPASLDEFSAGLPHLSGLFAVVRELGASARASLGDARLEWLSQLPRLHIVEGLAVLHASVGTLWRAPSEAEAGPAFEDLKVPLVVFGHLHRPFVSRGERATAVNAGSVGMPQDGDPRASYVLVDNGIPRIRRVEYDIDREAASLRRNRVPHATWIEKMLRQGRFVMPAVPPAG